MSGITGIFRRDGRDVDPADIKKMNDKIAHRGPDGSRVWCEGPVAFGHQMLHTTQESLHEILPFEDEESGLVITADARIDNRKDLAPQLGIEDNEHVSDSYFILKAYEKWGEKCPEELLGDFAFAIWDKNKEQLFCARDHMGVKPFYYYLNDTLFFFASEIKSLFNQGTPSKINKKRIAKYLMHLNDYSSTFFEDFFSLTPANYLIIKLSNVEKTKFWEICSQRSIDLGAEEEYIRSFRKIFEDSIKCRLRSQLPVGFELSGGMDSSSIVSMAKIIINDKKYSDFKKINTYSFIFNELISCDERNYISNIINEKTNPLFVVADDFSPLEQMKDILKYQNQPLLFPNVILLWELHKKMYNNNIRVLLCGTGGDAVVSHGEYYLRDLAVNFKWGKLLRELYYYTKNHKLHFYSKRFYYYLGLQLFPHMLKKIKNKDLSNILNKEFSNQINADQYLNKDFKSIKKIDTAKKYHYNVLSNSKGIIDSLMMRDGLSAAFFIEGRYPFLDKRLVEFCYAIPSEMKFKFGWSRYILRISMKNILPIENQWRSNKTNLSLVSKTNILKHEQKFFEEMIFKKNDIINEYVDLQYLKEIYNDYFLKKNISNSAYDLFLIAQLFYWLNLNKKYSG